MRLAQGFDEPSVEVMLHARKGSTNTTYQSYWLRFCIHCEERNLNPYNISIMGIVGFVERCRREKSWRHPTTKICIAALTAFRGKVEGHTVFTYPAMHEYLEGAKRLSMENIILQDP